MAEERTVTVFFNIYPDDKNGAAFIGFLSEAEANSVGDAPYIIAQAKRTITFDVGERFSARSKKGGAL